METTIAKWGNSLAIRIPKGLVESEGLSVGDTLELVKRDEVIALKKVRKIKKFQLSEVLGSFHSTQEVPYIDWGQPVGQESW